MQTGLQLLRALPQIPDLEPWCQPEADVSWCFPVSLGKRLKWRVFSISLLPAVPCCPWRLLIGSAVLASAYEDKWLKKRAQRKGHAAFIFLCGKHSEVWFTHQLLGGVAMKSATRVWCPQRRFLFWKPKGGARNPIPTCMASVIVHIILLWQKPLQPPGTGCWPRESVLPAAWGPQSWQLCGGVKGLRVRRFSWKAQVPVFLKIVGIPIDHNAGWGRKLKQCAPASVRIISCPVGHLSNQIKWRVGYCYE